METPMPLAPKDLHATRRGVTRNWIHDCQNSKLGRLGRPCRVRNLRNFVAPSLDSRSLISPLVPCPGL